jgi:hypothetical protein
MWHVADVLKGPLAAKLLVVAVFGGLITSILALAKPEAKA